MQQSVIMFHVGRSGSRVVGKLLDQHPEIDWQGEALKRPKVNKFAAQLSDPNDAAQLTRISIDPACVQIDADCKPLVGYLDDYSERFETLARLLSGRHSLTLTYEDDVSDDPRHAYRKVCDFLGLNAPEPEVPFGKTNPFPLSEIVTNLDEVATSLAGTRYEWMIE